MKIRHLSRIIAGLVLLAASQGCGGSEAMQNVTGTWQQTNSEKRVGTAPWQVANDVACRVDNTEEYAGDGSWTLYDGTNQCGSGGSSIIHGTWRLAASDTKIIYTYEDINGEYEATIEQLGAGALVLTSSTGDTAGTQIRSTYAKH
jgi:hypothetical protein